jgi:hypothetical protein
MKRDNIQAAAAEARRFLAAVEALPKPEPYESYGRTFMHDSFPKQQGAIRRASMDLTRALAEMRRP